MMKPSAPRSKPASASRKKPVSSSEPAGARLLVCAATARELRCWPGAVIAPVGRPGAVIAPVGRPGAWAVPGGRPVEKDGVAYLLTGVGIPLALQRVLCALQAVRPRLVVNLGIAGACPGSRLRFGDMAVVEQEMYGDLGLEVPGKPGFIPISDLSFGAEYRRPFRLLVPPALLTPGQGPRGHRARGSTVNLCTGTARTARLRRQVTEADLENMEGAAVAQAAGVFGVPAMEIRAISNLAARRLMKEENIQRALSNLTEFLRERQAVIHQLARQARGVPWSAP